MTDPVPWFSYANLPERASGPLLAVASRLIPGVGRVQAQVGPYAQAWREANLRALDGDGPLWVVLGDSLSQGVGASAYDRGWVGQARASLAAAGKPYRVVNLSVSGARTGEVLQRQLPALESLAASPAASPAGPPGGSPAGPPGGSPAGPAGGSPGRAPDLVSLLVGSNDLFNKERRGLLPATFQALLERVPVGTVVFTMPNPSQGAEAANGVLERVARKRGLVVAETRRPETQSWRGKLSDDHFHPNDLGYAGIAKIFVDAVLVR